MQESNDRDWACESRGMREFVAQLHAPRSSALMHAGSWQSVTPAAPCHALCLPRLNLLLCGCQLRQLHSQVRQVHHGPPCIGVRP